MIESMRNALRFLAVAMTAFFFVYLFFVTPWWTAFAPGGCALAAVGALWWLDHGFKD